MYRIYIFLLVCIFIFMNCVQGQADSDIDEENKGTIDDLIEDHKSEIGMPKLPAGLGLDQLDEETRAAYFKSLRAYLLYREIGFAHRQKVFDWQYVSSIIIFYTVIFLVLAGIYFSGVQFHSSLKKATSQKDTTKIIASVKGIQVTSPVLGVIILIISIMFFYLYLVYIYPIQEIL